MSTTNEPARTGPVELSILRRLTAPIRCRPDFLIIGAQKCGTTSLYHYLSGHPAVLPAKKKETHFFDSQFHLGPARYRAWFPPAAARWLRARKCGGRAVTGEATPYYLFHPLVPERVKRITPGSKFIAVLRNPIDRAYSHYQQSVRIGKEPLSFEEAIDREEERLAGEFERLRADPAARSIALKHHSYVARGRYAEQLARWFALFPRRQFLILSTEGMRADPEETFQRVLRFLGLSPWSPPSFEEHFRSKYGDMSPAARAKLERIFRLPTDFGERVEERDLEEVYGLPAGSASG